MWMIELEEDIIAFVASENAMKSRTS